MCQEYKCLITFASISGLGDCTYCMFWIVFLDQIFLPRVKKHKIKEDEARCAIIPRCLESVQSVLWMGFGLASALIYLCIIPIAPYKDDDDFFRVTLVKLYFEGPKCMPNGSYLGKFNEDYRNTIDLFTPDRVFSVMIAYVILNAIYFILSMLFFTSRKEEKKRKIVLGWSGMTLVLCIVDAILTAEVVLDVLSLRSYMNGSERLDVYTSSARGVLNEIPYIALVLALVSSRFVVCWLWNFFVGIFFFLDALCCSKITGKPPKLRKKVEDNRNKIVEELRQRNEDRENSVSLKNEKYYSAFDVRNNPDHLDFKKSMETVTRFNSIPENSSPLIENTHRNETSNDAYWHSSKSHSSKEWEMTNDGYVSDERNSMKSEKHFDFDHNLENFEAGQRKIKIVKPPIGKPVELVEK